MAEAEHRRLCINKRGGSALMHAPKKLVLVFLVSLLAFAPFQHMSAQTAPPADQAAPRDSSVINGNSPATASLQFWAKTYGGGFTHQAYSHAATNDGS